MTAEARHGQRVNQLVPLVAIRCGGSTARDNPVEDLVNATRTEAAGRTFAARLVSAKVEDVLDQFRNARPLVEADHTAVADTRTNRVQLLETQRRI